MIVFLSVLDIQLLLFAVGDSFDSTKFDPESYQSCGKAQPHSKHFMKSQCGAPHGIPGRYLTVYLSSPGQLAFCDLYVQGIPGT